MHMYLTICKILTYLSMILEYSSSLPREHMPTV